MCSAGKARATTPQKPDVCMEFHEFDFTGFLPSIQAKSGGDVKNAEDNKTTFLDGRSYAFHMRRVAAWAR